MAGYVLGLGDRHGGNILLGTASAECVHIDLGIAFEQGGRLGHLLECICICCACCCMACMQMLGP